MLLKPPMDVVDELLDNTLTASDKASAALLHIIYIDWGKNICFHMLLPLYAAFMAPVSAKKPIACILMLNALWALFVAHGLASPTHMDKPYPERLYANPMVVAICGGNIAALLLGIMCLRSSKAKRA
eukprot:CAMPEP_0197521420 /NCGR_PEP_ID=MMETSP1318-20131121/6699_1 /TAXON_ID=552666 /ORGANISM="Partenskyella glossopodia, Strain RCC365" /LENGTH=126 /DNA_ID=CAMNT_0043073411 /DNA_START=182 /DNA_END=562 /DNA_ORIENTATION=+